MPFHPRLVVSATLSGKSTHDVFVQTATTKVRLSAKQLSAFTLVRALTTQKVSVVLAT